MSEEEELNLKRLMEQSVDRQKRAVCMEMSRLHALSWKHGINCDCGKHKSVYVTVRVLHSCPVFTGLDGIQYAPRKGNIMKLPLLDAVNLLMRQYADFRISTALEIMQETP